MKIFWILFLLFPLFCYSAEVASINGVADTAIASISGVTGTSIASICGVDYDDGDSACNPATNEVGDRAEYTGAVNGGNDDARCLLAAAECSGTLGYGYAWHEAGSGTDNAKICVYLASTRALVACSGTISSSADGAWVETPGKLGGSVTASTNYYVCVVSDESIWTHGMYTSGDATVETVLEVGYDSPVDPLPAADSTDTSANLSAYVEIE
jgi:hypothetical protein